jgi:nitroimidazol reductase NimA-like FMN-containing flavoprotein (pyridoxamine 5'-phosphate oxidase superfamily)
MSLVFERRTRFEMPRDFNLDRTPPNAMLRSEYACDDQWIEAFLTEAREGRVGTRWDDQPFITPILFWYDPTRGEIYFHTNLVGRLKANSQRHVRACFETSRMGKLLPSNVALEFSVQYKSVIAFGDIRILEDAGEQRRALYGLLEKYFSEMKSGVEYRPISDQELKRTSVYAIAIDSWSGKRNWPEHADQSPDWPALNETWLAG